MLFFYFGPPHTQIERVKELYRELELEAVYARYEEETHKQIKELIARVDDIPRAVSELVSRGAEARPTIHFAASFSAICLVVWLYAFTPSWNCRCTWKVYVHVGAARLLYNRLLFFLDQGKSREQGECRLRWVFVHARKQRSRSSSPLLSIPLGSRQVDG